MAASRSQRKIRANSQHSANMHLSSRVKGVLRRTALRSVSPEVNLQLLLARRQGRHASGEKGGAPRAWNSPRLPARQHIRR